MRYLKRMGAFLLAAAVGLFLFGCGEKEEEPIAGDDWRTTGVVYDHGVLTRDGTDTEVCVCLTENSAIFYYDEPEQIYYDQVDFPHRMEDATSAYGGTFFDDLNGDGNSDVRVDFYHEDDTETTLIWYWDEEDGYVFREDESEFPVEEENDLLYYTGLWEYIGENVWIHIYDDATWSLVNSADEVIDSGVVLSDGSGVELHYDGNGDVLRLTLSGDGALLDEVNDGRLERVEQIEARVPYFEQAGISVNAQMDAGTYLLTDGACSYQGMGEGYSTGDCYWELNEVNDFTHDGIREIEFDAYCYIPEESISKIYDQQFFTVVTCALYDAYSGMWLTDASTYADASRGENHYVHTVDWNGESYEIEYFYSVEWSGAVGDWNQVLKKSYIVYLPENYDGLIFAAHAQPDNYTDSAKRMQLDSICPEAGLLDCMTIDPEAGLYFAVCF